MRFVNNISPRLGRLLREESGAALVELALVLPLLMLVFAVTIEGGRLLWAYQSASAGVRDASRYLARVAPVTICADGGSVAGYGTEIDAIVRTRIDGSSVFPIGMSLNSVVPTLSCISGSYRIPNVAVVSVTANLTITFPFADVIAFAGGTLPTVTTSITDRHRAFGT